MKNGRFKKTLALMLTLCLLMCGLPTAALSDALEEQPTAQPTAEVTAQPTAEATAAPAAEPTAEPEGEATAEPTPEPEGEATAEPTPEPEGEATAEPTAEATAEPTAEPEGEAEPTAEPTTQPEVALFGASGSNSEGEWNNTHAITGPYSLYGTATLDKNEANAGDTVTITITPNTGYALKSVTVTGDSGETVSVTYPTDITAWAEELKCTFTMPDENVNVQVNCQQLIAFTVKGVSTLSGGSKAVPGSTFYAWIRHEEGSSTTYAGSSAYWRLTCKGTTSTVTSNTVIQADDEYQLVWTISDLGILGISASCTADELPNKTISMYTIGEGATVSVTHTINGQSVACDITSVNCNDAVAFLNAVAGLSATSGGATRKWYISNTEVSAADQIVLKPTAYTSDVFITVATGMTNGNVTASTATAKAGDTVTLTVAPSAGYELDVLTVTAGSDSRKIETIGAGTDENGNSLYTFTMPGDDVTVSATFKQQLLTFTVYTEGSSNPQTYTCNAGEGLTFNGWWRTNGPAGRYTYIWRLQRGETTSVLGKYTDVLIQNGDVYTMIFAISQSLAAGSQPNVDVYADCDVSELDDAGKYSYKIHSGSLTAYHSVDGVKKSFVLTSSKDKLSDFAEGAQWYCNGAAVDMSALVPLAYTYYTTYISYGITVSAMENGSVTASTATAKAGDSVTLTVTPDEGYRLKTLSVTGTNGAVELTKNADGTYSFNMPESNVTVAAAFEKLYTLTIEGSAYVTADAAQYAAGDTVTFAISLPEGTVLADLVAYYTLNTTQFIDHLSSESFIMPAANVKVEAKMANGYTITVNVEGENDDCYLIDYPGKISFGGKYYAEANASVGLMPWYSRDDYRFTCTVEKDSDGTAVSCSMDSSGAYVFTMPAESVTVTVTFSAKTPSYVITIPSSVTLQDGENSMEITASDVKNLNGRSISVQALSSSGTAKSLPSGRGWLVSGANHIAYTFTHSLSFTQSGALRVALNIAEGETGGKPAGEYSDTLSFYVSLTGTSTGDSTDETEGDFTLEPGEDLGGEGNIQI